MPRHSSRYAALATERIQPARRDLETLSTRDIVRRMLAEEARAHKAALACATAIAAAADRAAASLARGGRLIYVGAGTSGRLAVLDAAELPPTFGSSPRQVRAIIAGGTRALTRAVEGAEDRVDDARRALARLDVGRDDTVCAIAASGMTPFAHAALAEARRRRAGTVFVTCVRDPRHARLADIVVAAVVGAEVLPGSTRLTAGSVTKMILNAISTAAMVRLGKVYRGRMVDVVPHSKKLRDRAQRIVAELAAVTPRRALALLQAADWRPKLALAMHQLGLDARAASRRLRAAGDDLRRLR